MAKPNIADVGKTLVEKLERNEKIKEYSDEFKLRNLIFELSNANKFKEVEIYKKAKGIFKTSCSGKNFYLRHDQIKTALCKIRYKIDLLDLSNLDQDFKDASTKTLGDIIHDPDQAEDIYNPRYIQVFFPNLSTSTFK